MKKSPAMIGTGALCLVLTACTSPRTEPSAPTFAAGAKAPLPAEEQLVSFTESIKPILAEKCTICHNAEVLTRRPYFETRETALQSGMIVPGKPELSRILTVIREDSSADKAMPPVGHRLTASDISLLKKWIAEGAHWPSGNAGRVTPAFIPQE